MTRERSDRDLGAALDAWMNEVAPTAVPVPVLEEAFARTMSSRQVRVYPWQRLVGRGGRSRRRTAFVLVATAALLVALLAFGSLGGGFGIVPSPSTAPSPTPSATPLPSTSPSSSPSPSRPTRGPVPRSRRRWRWARWGPPRVRTAIWVLSGTGLVQRIDPATDVAGPGIQLGSTTDLYNNISAAANGVWATDWDKATVYRIDPATSKVVAAIPAGLAPKGVLATATAVWVADTHDGKVLRIDPATNKVVATIVVGPAGNSGPNWLASGLGSIWVDIPNAFAVVRIDAITNAIQATIPIPAAIPCGGFAVTAVAVWNTTCDGLQAMSRIDPATNTVVKTTALTGQGNNPIVINGVPWLSIATNPGTLGRVSSATSTVDLNLAPSAMFGGGGDMVVAAGSLWVIDSGNDRVLRLPLTGFPPG